MRPDPMSASTPGAKATPLRRWLQRVKQALLARRVARSAVVPVKGTRSLERRQYATYDDYVAHQRSKLDIKGPRYLVEYDRRFLQALSERLRQGDGTVELTGRSVLCLAARIGTEVRAFQSCGAFAVGIDLNPGPDNRWVLPGDFHALQFADRSIDVVYTNSFDHVLNPATVIAEIRRVLKPSGVVLLELMADQGGQPTFGSYEVLKWAAPDDIVELFRTKEFEEMFRRGFDQPWPGIQIGLRKT
jgi:SAM-dependent methyltransferase